MTNLKTVLLALFTAVIALSASASAQKETRWVVQDFPVEENITGIHFFCPDTGYVVTSGGILARTFDGGVNWQPRRVSEYAALEDLHFTHGPIGILVGRSGTILRTRDGGYTWENESYYDTAAWLLDIQMIDHKNGVAIGATREPKERLGGLLLRTTDAGDTWNRIEVGGLGYSELVMPGDSTIRFLAYGAIYTSKDLGANWTSSLTFDGPPCRCLSIHGSSGITGGSSGAMAYSRDGGATWIQVQQDKKDLYVACQLVTERLGYMGGLDGLFKKTENGGSLWTDEALPVHFDVFDMQLVGTKLYVVGSNGTIVVGEVGK
jgi:photosystem II stability/assembly factor-like uncharacterized protein